MRLRFSSSAWLNVLLGLVLMAVSNFVLLRQHNLGAEEALQAKAEQMLLSIEEVQSKLDSLSDIPLSFDGAHSESEIESKGLEELGLDMFVFDQSGPRYWTTHEYSVSINAQGSDLVELQKHGDLYVLCWQKVSQSQTTVFALPLIRSTRGADSLQSKGRNAERYDIVANPEQGSLPISVAGVPFFYLKIVEFRAPIHWDLVFILGLALLGLGTFNLFQGWRGGIAGRLLALFLFATVEYSFRTGTILPNLNHSALFAFEFFKANRFDASLGLLFVHALEGLLLIDMLRILSSQVRSWGRAGIRRVLAFMVLGLVLFSTAYVLAMASALVQRGLFSLDLKKLHLLEPLSLAALLALAVLFMALHWLLRLLVSLVAHRKEAILMAVLAVIVPAVFVLFTGTSWRWYALGELLVLGWGFLELAWSGQRENGFAALRIVVPCLVIGLHLNLENKLKEESVQYELICEMSLAEHDVPVLELLNVQRSFPSDPGLLNYFRYNTGSKSEFEQRIRQIYLPGTEQKFQLSIYDFDPNGVDRQGVSAFDEATLKTLFHSPESKTIGERFKRLETKSLYGSYLGQFEVRDGQEKLGTVYLLLSPQTSSSSGRLTEALSPSVLKQQIADYGYSSARYVQGRLSHQEGNFRYPIALFSGEKQPLVLLDSSKIGHAGEYRISQKERSGFWKEMPGYRHLVWLDENGNATVLSKPQDRSIENLTSFTLIALFGFLVLIGKYAVEAWMRFWKPRYTRWLTSDLWEQESAEEEREFFLSSRLRISVTWLVFGIFMVVLFITINFSSTNYERRQREFLSEQAAEISNTLQRQANLNALFGRYETGILDELSEYYNTDINLYDTKGRLLVSSNESLFRDYHHGRLMNPEAYREFQQDRISACIKTEYLGDLEYISAYTALLDNDLNTVGYLNLPYFSNRSDLYRELSEYGSTLINLFALVFALAAFVANALALRISHPLNWIRNQMGALHLGSSHQRLSWEKKDEIGLLVAAYNTMVEQLEASLNQLAESERQGAWREMAKQVAHEIKNPLTPMRLSLQHLQQAIRRGDENLVEKFQRTSELLIQQIDALSNMAEEFSSFAKMPDPVMARHDLVEVLSSAVALMGKEHASPLEWNPPRIQCWVWVDQQQLGRVFNNLIKNAIQSIPEDRMGHIRVELQAEESRVQVRITDNGKGIAEDLRSKIFSPNFSTKNSGMGLGLAMSKKMIEQFGGEIWFRSELGQGTIFYVSLPVLSESDSTLSEA